MLNALPRICGTTGPRAVSSRPYCCRAELPIFVRLMFIPLAGNWQIPSPKAQIPDKSQSPNSKSQFSNPKQIWKQKRREDAPHSQSFAKQSTSHPYFARSAFGVRRCSAAFDTVNRELPPSTLANFHLRDITWFTWDLEPTASAVFWDLMLRQRPRPKIIQEDQPAAILLCTLAFHKREIRQRSELKSCAQWAEEIVLVAR